MVSLHAEMSSEYDISTATTLWTLSKGSFLKAGVEAVVHIDPVCFDSHFEEIRDSLIKAIKEVNGNYSIHDLRVLRTPEVLPCILTQACLRGQDT